MYRKKWIRNLLLLTLSALIFALAVRGESWNPSDERTTRTVTFNQELPQEDFPQQKRSLLASPARFERRMDTVLRDVSVIQWDQQSRFVFFGDCHRGIKDEEDMFMENEGLYLKALGYYLNNGFTLIEVGDGDDLWGEHGFDDIMVAYPEVFDLFRKFQAESRLHFILGNHEILEGDLNHYSKGEFKLSEGLLLNNSVIEKKILVIHGHQADWMSDRFQPISRQVVNLLWSRIRHTAWAQALHNAVVRKVHTRIEVGLANWINPSETVIITGHTHQLHFPEAEFLPIFNTGMCSAPGSLFGIELQASKIWPIVWQEVVSNDDGVHQYQRLVLGPPFDLETNRASITELSSG